MAGWEYKTLVYVGKAVGMGRIVGDGGCNYEIVDIAVVPEHQGKGLGSQVMAALMNYLRENAVPTAYVSLIADVPGFYERFGFRLVRPSAEGMELRVE
jgi:ribosomal protein S18 acetylase RimI-like enzyme